MSKLTKLFKSPVSYFCDSRIFRHNKLSGAKEALNLFVVANYGQLHQAEKLIKYEALENNLLCVVYTDSNLRMPKLIKESYNKDLFSSVVINRLPVRPNSLDIENIVYISRCYKKLLTLVRPENLYLLSFEAHYALLAHYAKIKGIKCNLIEEGTGSYKFDSNGNNLSPVIPPPRKIKDKIIKWLLSMSPYYSFIKEFKAFDHVYCAFPEVMACGFPTSNYTKYFLHAEGSKSVSLDILKIIRQYSFNKESTIFVSQRYGVNQKDYISSIIDSLISFNNTYKSPVYIKLHPKETVANRKMYEKILINRNVNSSCISVIQDNEFLVEDVISVVKPFCIIGLSSTSLVYTGLVSPSTKCISIAPYVINELERLQNSSEQSLRTVISHYSIIQKFPHIINQKSKFSDFSILNETIAHSSETVCIPKSDASLIDSITQKINDDCYHDALQLIDENSRPILLSHPSWLSNSARLYYKQGKLWKSYCYYTWALQYDDYLPTSLECNEYIDLAYSLFATSEPIISLVNFSDRIRILEFESNLKFEDVVAINLNKMKLHMINSDIDYIYNKLCLIRVDSCPVSRAYYVLLKLLIGNMVDIKFISYELEVVINHVINDLDKYRSCKIEVLKSFKSSITYLFLLNKISSSLFYSLVDNIDYSLHGKKVKLNAAICDDYLYDYMHQLDTYEVQSRFSLIEREQVLSAYHYYKSDNDKAYGYIRVKEKLSGKSFVSDKLAFHLNMERCSYKKTLSIYDSIFQRGFVPSEKELLNVSLFRFYVHRDSKNLIQLIRVYVLYGSNFSNEALKIIGAFLFARKRYGLCAKILLANANDKFDEKLVLLMTKSLVFTKQYMSAIQTIGKYHYIRSVELALINIRLSVLVDDVATMKSAWLKLLELDSSKITKDELRFYSQLMMSHNLHVRLDS
ncbi:alpha-2,8-polysialyltransferase family protein [Cobetia amphilecti]|uniref:alpha-2,8-polysialyltransferase family protein n=1 Tax=Cobetia amphilecti TaxID=1055104 RepID=UPI00255100D6|nr:alpha-2,8-polysialyltransferase family protein [Cobetia amphilecti]